MHHLQLSFSVLVCVFLSVCTQEADELTADSITTLKSACKKDGQLLQITEAFFCNQQDFSPCDHKCKPNDESQPPSLCFAPSDPHRHKVCNNTASCRLRFSLDELNKVYEAVDTEHSSGNVDELFDGRGKYVVHYVCGDGDNQKQINPCHGHKDHSLGENYTSLLIRRHPSDHSECRTVCDLEPRGYFKLNIFFVLADPTTNEHANFMTYKIHSNSNNDDADEDECTMVHSGYFKESDEFFTNSTIKIRLHFNDLSTVWRFWINLGGTPFTLKCTPEEMTTTQHGSTSDTTVSTSSYRTEEPEKPTTGQAGKEDGIPAYTYVVPVVIIALVIGIIIAGVFFVRRRQQLRVKQTLGGDCRGTAPDNTPEEPQPESTYQQVNNEMQAANPAVESPYSVANKDDEYGRLALSGRPDRQREVNDLYDHATTLSKPEGDDVYNVVNRDQKKQGVLDNIYDRTVKE